MDKVERARAAQQLFDSPIWKELREVVREKMHVLWQNTRPGESQQREWLYLVSYVAELYDEQIKAFCDHGKILDYQDRERRSA